MTLTAEQEGKIAALLGRAPGPAERMAAKEWLDSRPLHVLARIADYPPDGVYRLTTTGQKVRIISYTENEQGCDTCTIGVSNRENPGGFQAPGADGWAVYGVKFTDLVPWMDPKLN